MKAITFTYQQYTSSSLAWTYLYNCDATDFVFIPPKYPTPTNAVNDMANAIKTLIDGRGLNTTNVYIGTPGIDSTNFTYNPSASTLTSFLSSVYNNPIISSSTYQSKIAGAYMNQEALYGAVDYTNILNGTQPGNKQIKRMYDINTWVKAGNIGGTNFLWIPYYGFGSDPATIIKNIGYVTDAVQIFDYVIMQPHVFFDQTTTNGNFLGIKYSMIAGKICYRNGVDAVLNKVSNTQIGFEMEFSIYSPNYSTLYAQYTSEFAYYTSYPQAFYWAGYGDSTTFGNINNWY
jgi:hypothetical protein